MVVSGFDICPGRVHMYVLYFKTETTMILMMTTFLSVRNNIARDFS